MNSLDTPRHSPTRAARTALQGDHLGAAARAANPSDRREAHVPARHLPATEGTI